MKASSGDEAKLPSSPSANVSSFHAAMKASSGDEAKRNHRHPIGRCRSRRNEGLVRRRGEVHHVEQLSARLAAAMKASSGDEAKRVPVDAGRYRQVAAMKASSGDEAKERPQGDGEMRHSWPQ